MILTPAPHLCSCGWIDLSGQGCAAELIAALFASCPPRFRAVLEYRLNRTHPAVRSCTSPT